MMANEGSALRQWCTGIVYKDVWESPLGISERECICDLATAQMRALPCMWLSWHSVKRNPGKSCPFYWATLERQSAAWSSSLREVLRSRCRPFQLQVARNSPTGCTSMFPSSTAGWYTSCKRRRDPSRCPGYK